MHCQRYKLHMCGVSQPIGRLVPVRTVSAAQPPSQTRATQAACVRTSSPALPPFSGMTDAPPHSSDRAAAIASMFSCVTASWGEVALGARPLPEVQVWAYAVTHERQTGG